jgi:hypothetical protein
LFYNIRYAQCIVLDLLGCLHLFIFILTGEIPVCAGSGEGSLQELNDCDNDEQILGFRPAACMDKVEKSAPLVHASVMGIIATQRDHRNTLKTRDYKRAMAFIPLAQMCKLHNKDSFPVFSIFMCLFLFAVSLGKHIMNTISGFGMVYSYKTLENWMKRRALRMTSVAYKTVLAPITSFLLFAYDNFVRACRKIRQQRFGRKTDMINGNMQCLLRMFVPADVQIGVGEPLQSLLTVRPEHIMSDASQDSYLLVRKRRMVQVAMKAFGVYGVPYPISGVRDNSPPIKSDFSTLQFNAEDVGTTPGNRKVLQGYSTWSGVDSQAESITRKFSFVAGDQMTYMHMQNHKLTTTLMTGIQSWIVPIPGDFHFYCHNIGYIFILGPQIELY